MDREEHLGLRVPPELKRRLADAAKTAGHSLSDEIRARLEQSFEAGGGDPVFQQVLDGLKRTAFIADFYGQFEEQPHANYGLFEIAAAVLIEAGRPEGFKPLPIHNEWVAATTMYGAAQPGSTEGIPGQKVAAVLKRKQGGENDGR